LLIIKLFIVTNATCQVTLHDSDCAESGAKVRFFIGMANFFVVFFLKDSWLYVAFCVFLGEIFEK